MGHVTTPPPDGWRREMTLVLLLGGIFCLARAALIGISDPSEGRYCQISWEMAESGDWIVPHWNGIPHLEKPPLAYWAGAAGVKLLGRNELGLRLFATLALLAAAALTGGIARRAAGPRAAALAAAGVCLFAFPMAVGAALLTDGFLLLGAALFHYALVRRMKDGGNRVLDLAPVGLAIGLLAKGHTIFLFTLVPALFARTGVLREAFRPRRILLLLILVVPWFVAVSLAFRDFFAMQGVKLLDFLFAGRQHHRAPVYVYAAVLLFGVAPLSFRAIRGLIGFPGRERMLLALWLAIPLVVLSAVPSRSWTYILPAVPPLAVLGARGLLEGPARRFRFAGGGIMLLGGAITALGLLFPGIHERVAEFRPMLLMLAPSLVLAGLFTLAMGERCVRVAMVASGLVISTAVSAAAYVNEEPFRIHRALAHAVHEAAGENTPVIVVERILPSLPVYLGRFVIVVGVDDRLAEEKRLWGERDGRNRYRPDADPAEVLKSERGSVFVLRRPHWQILAPEVTPFYDDGDHVVLAKRE